MSRDPFSFDSEDRSETGNRSEGRGWTLPEEEPLRSVPPARADLGDLSLQPEKREREPETQDFPRAYHFGKRIYFVRNSEIATLAEVGMFRLVAAGDLARFSYAGDSNRMEREVRRLKKQELLKETVLFEGRGKPTRVLSLTKSGMKLLVKSGAAGAGQAFYHGLARPREAKHDAILYRLFQREAARIESGGGRATRVVLDYQLQRELQQDLAALGPEGQTEEARESVARMHKLAMVNGRIQVPDLRVEYVGEDMELRHVDLELTTRNYRPQALAEKAQAGFSLYASPDDAPRLRRALDAKGLGARIVSL